MNFRVLYIDVEIWGFKSDQRRQAILGYQNMFFKILIYT